VASHAPPRHRRGVAFSPDDALVVSVDEGDAWEGARQSVFAFRVKRKTMRIFGVVWSRMDASS
jgi:hypothetical protein